MKPGQELYIAGLLSSNNGRDITKTPIYGEIPVLGALYRSKAFLQERKRTGNCHQTGSHLAWNTWTTETAGRNWTG